MIMKTKEQRELPKPSKLAPPPPPKKQGGGGNK